MNEPIDPEFLAALAEGEDSEEEPDEPTVFTADQADDTPYRAPEAPPTPPQARQVRRRPRAQAASTSSTAQPQPKPRAVGDPHLKDPASRWVQIIEELAGEGLGPNAAVIRVERFSVGLGNQSPPAKFSESIDGGSVAGNEDVSPGDELVSYVADCYHATVKGAARYELEFVSKVGAKWLGNASITLAPYDEIRRQREFAARRRGESAEAPAYEPGPSRGVGVGRYPQSRFMGAPQAQPRGESEVQALRREIAALNGRHAAILEMTGDRSEMPQQGPQDIASAVAMGVAQALKAVGFGAPPVAVPLPTPAQVTTAVNDPLAGVEALFAGMERIRSFEKKMRHFSGIPEELPKEEPEEPIQGQMVTAEERAQLPFDLAEIPMATGPDGKPLMWPSNVEGGFFDWLQAFAGCNPGVSMRFFEVAAKTLDQSAFAQLIAKMSGGAATQVPPVVSTSEGPPNQGWSGPTA